MNDFVHGLNLINQLRFYLGAGNRSDLRVFCNFITMRFPIIKLVP